ncbi:MAG TPA: type 1 glutamine amidotransferase [Chromatiales bacterium]|nr:type 1 glutamine amidotransferase [Chromatiales bacterium]
MKRVLFVSMIGEPGRYDPAIYADIPGGDDEVHWVLLQLRELGLADRVDYRGVRICRGEALPAPGEADAVILGGSYHSVHDDLDWQRRTRDWLERYRGVGGPLLGICGGHQMVCEIDGATVEPLASGVMAGTMPVTLTDAGRAHFLFSGCREEPVFHWANEERVARPPDGALVLATRPEIPCAALDHGGGWYSVQFHPEATHRSMAVSWRPQHPEYAENYRPAPQGGRLMENFLKGTGIV